MRGTLAEATVGIGAGVDPVVLLELATIVLDGQSAVSALERVARIAQRTIPGAEQVSLTVIRGSSCGDIAAQTVHQVSRPR
jgi:hypothetical protein